MAAELEHLPNPKDFIDTLAKAIDNPDVIFSSEHDISNALVLQTSALILGNHPECTEPTILISLCQSKQHYPASLSSTLTQVCLKLTVYFNHMGNLSQELIMEIVNAQSDPQDIIVIKRYRFNSKCHFLLTLLSTLELMDQSYHNLIDPFEEEVDLSWMNDRLKSYEQEKIQIISNEQPLMEIEENDFNFIQEYTVINGHHQQS